MKKENRKMAQERRAKERQKAIRNKKILRILIIVVCAAAVIALVCAIVISSISSSSSEATTESSSTVSQSSEDTSSTSEAASTEDSSSSPVLNTDTSLTVADGDTVNIDYVGTIDGVEFDGGSTNGNGADLVIGSGSYIDDFEDQLIGAHVGDTVEVNVTFPSDYGMEELQGQDAVFTVTINGIYE